MKLLFLNYSYSSIIDYDYFKILNYYTLYLALEKVFKKDRFPLENKSYD